jgi:hypothetical protein
VAVAVGEAVGEAVAAVVAAAVAVAVGEAVVAAEAVAQLGCPRRKPRAAVSRPPSAWLSSRSRPPRTPRGARVRRSCGWSTCHGVYGEAPDFARDLCLSDGSTRRPPMRSHM